MRRTLVLVVVAGAIALLGGARAFALEKSWEHFPYGSPSQSVLVGVVAGPDHNVWFTDSQNDALVRIAPDGSTHAFPLVANVGGKPQSFSPGYVTVGADQRFYMGGCFRSGSNCAAGGYVGAATIAGLFSVYPTGGPNPTAYTGFTLGPDGNVWFTDFGRIARITTRGAVTELGIPRGFYPTGDIASANGRVSFVAALGSSCATYRLLAIDPATGHLSGRNLAIPTCDISIGGLGRDAAGNLYTGYLDDQNPNNAYYYLLQVGGGGRQISFINDVGQMRGPQSLVEGPDGKIWFVSEGFPNGPGGPVLVRFDPARGAFTQLVPPFQFGLPQSGGLTVGPDGNLWMLDAGFIDVYGL